MASKEEAAAAAAQAKADIAANLAAEKAAIADASAAKRAAIAADAAAEKAAAAAIAAEQKANIAARLTADKAASAASLAEQKANSAGRLQQEKSVQQAILAAQKNAAASGEAFDKRAHDARMAQIKSEATVRAAELRKESAQITAAAKQPSRARKDDKMGGLLGGAEGGMDLKSMLGGGMMAGLAIKAGTKLLDAAEKLVSAAVELTIAGVHLGIEETSKKEVQSAAMGKMGGDYEATVKAALKLGMNPDDAVAQAKKLLNAKFSQSEIPLLLKIKSGMDLAGLDGDALLKKLEVIKLEPKVKAKDIDGLAKLGVDTKKVYEELAKSMGVSVPVAMAKVKSGAADSEKVIKAIEKVQAAKFGPLADILGNTVPALLAKVKFQFAQIFDSFNLEPLKSALKNVSDAFEGPEGKAMRSAAGEAGSAILEAVFGPFAGAGGRNRMTTLAAEFISTMHAIKAAADAAKPAIKEFYATFTSPKKESIKQAVEGVDFKKRQTAGGIGLGGFGGFEDAKTALGGLDLGPANDIMGDHGVETGKSLTDGMVNGINDGSGDAVGAAVAMAERVLAAVKARLGVHSPSTEFGEVGGFASEGMAKGIAGNDNASRAASGMARNALGAAAGAAAGAGGIGGAGAAGAAGGGAGGITINIISATAADAPKIKAELDKGMPGWLAMARAHGRASREGRAA